MFILIYYDINVIIYYKMHLYIGLMCTCVNQRYIDQIQGCVDTWMQNLPSNVEVFLLGGEIRSSQCPYVISLPNIKDDYHSATLKQWHGLMYMHQYAKEHNKPGFYYIGGSDNYIEVNNMLQCISKFKMEDSLYIGGHGWTVYLDKSIYFHAGGGGFLLSQNALDLMVPYVY